MAKPVTEFDKRVLWWILLAVLVVLALCGICTGKPSIRAEGGFVPQAYLPWVVVDRLTPVPTATVTPPTRVGPTATPWVTRPPWETATPTPTATATATPILCELSIENRISDWLYYVIPDTEIGWEMYKGGWGSGDPPVYGRFPPNTYTWVAESRECGQANGLGQFLPSKRYHTFTCVEGVLIGVLR